MADTMNTTEWIGQTNITAITATIVGAARTVNTAKQLIVTVQCVTPPGTGLTHVKLQHAPNYDSVTAGSETWEDLIVFESFDSQDADAYRTEMTDRFHHRIRIVGWNSEADQTPKISVYIRGLT